MSQQADAQVQHPILDESTCAGLCLRTLVCPVDGRIATPSMRDALAAVGWKAQRGPTYSLSPKRAALCAT